MLNIRHIRGYCRMGAYIREFSNDHISNDYISSNGYICNDYICCWILSEQLVHYPLGIGIFVGAKVPVFVAFLLPRFQTHFDVLPRRSQQQVLLAVRCQEISQEALVSVGHTMVTRSQVDTLSVFIGPASHLELGGKPRTALCDANPSGKSKKKPEPEPEPTCIPENIPPMLRWCTKGTQTSSYTVDSVT